MHPPRTFPPPRTFTPPAEGYRIVNEGRTYVLGEELGEGYFGKVYACTDDWANELVAKVLLPRNRPYEEVRKQWLHELGNLVSLRHPNITFVYDAFEAQDTFYLVIERCEGDLAGLIGHPDVEAQSWLPYLARDILQALDFIHRNGYAHKDLHPGNVFTGTVRDRMFPGKAPVVVFKVGDLGISRLETEINVMNTILAQWMLPPEAIDARYGVIGRAVDIYHAGLLFLILLIGTIPEFSAKEILAGEPRQIAESVRSPYGPPIARALRRHVAYRTPSAIELWKDLFAAVPRVPHPAV